MHADDAVQWHLWGDEVLAQAEREQKLIFISSGYFACHWCHVMQRESFRHEVIAALLNSRFIPVKIDRELNPELDAHLFEFVAKSRGVAGWPLNAFLTPQGHPLIGSGYQTAEEFLALIKDLQVRWENEGEGLSRLAAEAAHELENSLPLTPTRSRHEMMVVLRRQLLERLFSEADLLEGGVGDGAKFPRVSLLQALMLLPPEPELDEYLQLTLEAMAANGLRDHLGGCFFRYTVDPGWQQPHFEKMLFDNAQHAALYLDAARRWSEDGHWREVGLETLDCLLRDFSHPEDGYIASLSAVDGDGVEGGYYLWQREAIEALLSLGEWRIFQRSWRLQQGEEWQGGLPIRMLNAEGLASTLRMPLSESQQWLTRIRNKLLQARAARTLPRDSKRLAGWNGLMLSALARGVSAGGGERYRQAGEALRNFLLSLWDGERLWRTPPAGGGDKVVAGLEDYAFVAQGLFDWSEALQDGEARRLASRLGGEAYYRFFRDGSWYVGSGVASPLPPKRLLPDGALPSAAVVIAALGRRFADASPLIPGQLNDLLFADPQTLLQKPLDYPGYIAEIQLLERRASRLSLDLGLE